MQSRWYMTKIHENIYIKALKGQYHEKKCYKNGVLLRPEAKTQELIKKFGMLPL